MKNQIKEAITRCSMQAHLMRQGWMVYSPAADVGGVDWIAINQITEELRKVQQKERFLINKKYVGKNIWLCVETSGKVYLTPHDILMQTDQGQQAQTTKSWAKGEYSWPNPAPKALLNYLDAYAI